MRGSRQLEYMIDMFGGTIQASSTNTMIMVVINALQQGVVAAFEHR